MNFEKFRNTNFIFIVNNYKAFGGAERQALILATYLLEHVTENVAFLALGDGENFKSRLEALDITTYCFPFNHNASKAKKIIQYLNLIRFLKKLNPDVLIPYVAESNKVVAQIWKHTGAKFAFWNQREEGRKLYGSKRENKLIRQLPAIVSNSFEGKQALMRVYGLEAKDIIVINNGVVPYGKDVTIINWHEKLDIEPSRPLVAMIANITDRKDHETLFKAWKKVVDWCKNNERDIPFLILAGRKANAYNKLRLLAFDLKLSDHMAFTGEINPVQPLIQGSLFCVFSSNLEGCPNGVLECMEQGKAVIGTDISGVRQALGNRYENNCISQPNNPDSLFEKIIGLYKSPDLIEEIGHYNSQKIASDFSVEKMAKAHLKLIEEKIFEKE